VNKKKLLAMSICARWIMALPKVLSVHAISPCGVTGEEEKTFDDTSNGTPEHP
jgi:hypothetical protein